MQCGYCGENLLQDSGLICPFCHQNNESFIGGNCKICGQMKTFIPHTGTFVCFDMKGLHSALTTP